MINKYTILEFGNRVVDFLHIKQLAKPLYYKFYKDKKERKMQESFRINGVEAIAAFNKCMLDNKIPYSLAFGTLLGAVREHGFIKHDLDIDLFIWAEDWHPGIIEMLKDYGFKLSHTFIVDGGSLAREETYVFKGFHLDIFYIYPTLDGGVFPYCCDFLGRDCFTYEGCMQKYGSVLPRRIEMPFIKSFKRGIFEGLELPIPYNAEELLSFRYGSDYMIPNPEWGIQSHNDHIVEWADKEGIYISFE